MTVSLKHAFASAKADSGDATLIQPSNWNAEHTLTQATGKLLGRSTAGVGATEEISVGTGLSLSGGTLSASGGGLPLQLPIQDGRYYSAPFAVGGGAASNSVELSSFHDYIVAIPFTARDAKTWTEIGVFGRVEGASDVARLGIYADNNGLPGDLILDAGEVTFDAEEYITKTISQALSANTWYWLAMAISTPTGTAVVAGIAAAYSTSVANALASLVFGISSVSGDTATNGVYAPHTYGALPDPFPEIEDYSTDPVPLIWLRTGV